MTKLTGKVAELVLAIAKHGDASVFFDIGFGDGVRKVVVGDQTFRGVTLEAAQRRGIVYVTRDGRAIHRINRMELNQAGLAAALSLGLAPADFDKRYQQQDEEEIQEDAAVVLNPVQPNPDAPWNVRDSGALLASMVEHGNALAGTTINTRYAYVPGHVRPSPYSAIHYSLYAVEELKEKGLIRKTGKNKHGWNVYVVTPDGLARIKRENERNAAVEPAQEEEKSQEPLPRWPAVSPGTLATLGQRIHHGPLFSVSWERWDDDAREHGETFDRAMFPGEMALDDAIELCGGLEGPFRMAGDPGDSSRWFEANEFNTGTCEEIEDGIKESRILHIPPRVTPSSFKRLARLLGFKFDGDDTRGRVRLEKDGGARVEFPGVATTYHETHKEAVEALALRRNPPKHVTRIDGVGGFLVSFKDATSPSRYFPSVQAVSDAYAPHGYGIARVVECPGFWDFYRLPIFQAYAVCRNAFSAHLPGTPVFVTVGEAIDYARAELAAQPALGREFVLYGYTSTDLVDGRRSPHTLESVNLNLPVMPRQEEENKPVLFVVARVVPEGESFFWDWSPIDGVRFEHCTAVQETEVDAIHRVTAHRTYSAPLHAKVWPDRRYVLIGYCEGAENKALLTDGRIIRDVTDQILKSSS